MEGQLCQNEYHACLDCEALGLIVSLEFISFIEVKLKSFEAFELVLTHQYILSNSKSKH